LIEKVEAQLNQHPDADTVASLKRRRAVFEGALQALAFERRLQGNRRLADVMREGESAPATDPVASLVRLIANAGKCRGLTLTELELPISCGGQPVHAVVIDATKRQWNWFIRSPYLAPEWTIVKQDRNHTQAVKIVG